MTTIAKDCVTVIHVFSVEPAKQQQLIDLLCELNEKTVRHFPGFISSNIHKSLDGTRVAIYAQWRSVAEFQNMVKTRDTIPLLEQLPVLAASLDAKLYEVVEACNTQDK